MENLILPLVNWNNGIVMIAVFALVCVVVVAVVMNMIKGDKKSSS